MENKINDGKVLEYTNATGSDIASGDAVLVGALICIAANNIKDTEEGSVHTEGRFTVPKAAAQAWTQGAKVYYATGAANFTTTASGNTLVGTIALDALSADTEGEVLINKNA